MELTPEQLSYLRSLKTLQDSDDIRFKEIIKKKLIENPMVIYLLNNKELEECDADPSDYLGVNILPYYLIHQTQHNCQNYICYEIQTREEHRYNSTIKYGQVIFYVLCEEKNNIEKQTGIARHDLLSALIIREFNWSNLFGKQIHLVSDIPSVTDNDYATRTLTFEGEMPNNIVKSNVETKTPRVINKLGSQA